MSNEICVAMCVYNAAATLRQALDSLKAQTFADFDLVVVDDGSTDGSAEILESYRPIFPSMTVVRQKNGGIGVARNAAVALSGHKWLAFIDSDDVWHPAKLACQLRVAQGDAALDDPRFMHELGVLLGPPSCKATSDDPWNCKNR